MKKLAMILLTLMLPAAALAEQAAVKKEVPVAGATDSMTIAECLGVMSGLQVLDAGHRVIIAAGKPTESAETVRYKSPPDVAAKVSDAIGHNLFVLGQVQQEAQSANRRAQAEIGAGEAIKPGSKENLVFDQRMADYTARPCHVELDHIRAIDLDPEVPGSVKALIWKILDR